MLAVSGELQAPTGSSNFGGKLGYQHVTYSPRRTPAWQSFLQNPNMDLLEGFSRIDLPGEMLQREDLITYPSNDAAFVFREGDAYLHADILQASQRDVIIILNRRTGNISNKTVLSVDQLYYQ